MESVAQALQTGIAAHEAGRLDEAAAIYQQILAQEPRHADTLQLLGVIAQQRGRHADAVSLIEQAIAIDGRSPAHHSNLGEALRALGEYDRAAAAYRRALELDPGFPAAHNNLGLVLQILGNLPGAVHHHERAVKLVPTDANAHYNLACALLAAGDFEHGWLEYTWRMHMPGHPSQTLAHPMWTGAPLADQRLAIYGEQGLGDALQFVRYLPLVTSRVADVMLVVPPALVSILAASGYRNLASERSAFERADVQCSLLTLPGLFGTKLATIPRAVPYLRAEPRLIDSWRQRLAPLAGYRIGIAWQGNPKQTSDALRSMPLTEFEPLARVSGVRLISLQVGTGAEQVDALRGRFEVTQFADLDTEHGAFLDTAAIMSHLDLVITTDTAIAHLAGGLGVPVWVALSAAPDWRWMRGRSDSPWYPTMRLFRQQTLHRWSDVFETMAAMIAETRGES